MLMTARRSGGAKRTPAQKDSFLAQRSAFMITPLSAADCSVLRPISAMAMDPEGADTWAKLSHAFAAFVEDQPVEAVGKAVKSEFRLGLRQAIVRRNSPNMHFTSAKTLSKFKESNTWQRWPGACLQDWLSPGLSRRSIPSGLDNRAPLRRSKRDPGYGIVSRSDRSTFSVAAVERCSPIKSSARSSK